VAADAHIGKYHQPQHEQEKDENEAGEAFAEHILIFLLA
jgi:hypothetical protein